MIHEDEADVFVLDAAPKSLVDKFAERGAFCVHEFKYDETAALNLFSGGIGQILDAGERFWGLNFEADVVDQEIWSLDPFWDVDLWNANNSLWVVSRND